MTKTLTEQWREGKLPCGAYYVNRLNEIRIYLVTYEDDTNTHEIYEILAPVPDYMDCKRLMYDSIELDKAKIKIYELVSKTDELMQKIHILNEQNTKQYNELCEEIKKNNILEKRLEIATKALEDILNDGDDYWDKDKAQQALTKMEGVK